MPPITRIASDLHIGHRASMLDAIEYARPLAEGVDHLILNGDTLELKYGDLANTPVAANTLLKRFEEETANWGVKISLVTGNHDPAISDLHALELAQGRVFVTHGDALFKVIAPWRANLTALTECTSNISGEETGNGMADLDALMAKVKQASIQAHLLEGDYNPTLWGKTKIFLHQLWPPTIPFRILKCWREVPDRAVSLTERFGLSPQVIIIGHSHNPGIWKRHGQTVINLGSLFPWPGSQCVDLVGERLLVRRIQKQKNQIKLSQPIREIPLS